MMGLGTQSTENPLCSRCISRKNGFFNNCRNIEILPSEKLRSSQRERSPDCYRNRWISGSHGGISQEKYRYANYWQKANRLKKRTASTYDRPHTYGESTISKNRTRTLTGRATCWFWKRTTWWSRGCFYYDGELYLWTKRSNPCYSFLVTYKVIHQRAKNK